MSWTRAGPLALFAALVLVYLVAGAWTTRRAFATGDEPRYLMAADSLAHGEGFDIVARWQALGASSYDPGDPVPREELELASVASLSRPGRYPVHDLGLPILAAPFLALGGRALVVAAIAIAMAAAVALGYRTALRLGASRARALWGALATGLAAPALTYSGQVFPDAIAPLAVATAIASLARAAPAWLLGPAIAALPLLHVRYWPLALGLLLATLVLRGPSYRELARLIAPLVIVLVLAAILDLAIYGIALPHAGFVLFYLSRHAAIETYAGAHGIAGLFVDRAFGLVPAAPLAVLLFAGAGSALRERAARWLVLAVVPYLVLVPFVDWTGGFSPQARYLAPLVPLMPLLYALAFSWRPAAIAAVPLAIWTAGQSAIFVVAPWLRYDAYGVPALSDRAWVLVSPIAPSAVFPLFGTDGATVVLTALWCAGLLGLAAAAYRRAGVSATAARAARS
jgi:hypothetical protein